MTSPTLLTKIEHTVGLARDRSGTDSNGIKDLSLTQDKTYDFQGSKTSMDVLAGQGVFPLSPEKTPGILEDSEIKQDINSLRGDVNQLKQRFNQLSLDSPGRKDNSSSQYTTPAKGRLRNELHVSDLAESPEKNQFSDEMSPLRESYRSFNPQESPKNAGKTEKLLSDKLQQVPILSYQNSQQPFQTPLPNHDPKEDRNKWMFNNQQFQNDKEIVTSRQSTERKYDYSTPLRSNHGSEAGNLTDRSQIRANYASLMKYPPYHKKEALYQPKYKKSTSPKQDPNSPVKYTEKVFSNSETKRSWSTKETAAEQKIRPSSEKKSKSDIKQNTQPTTFQDVELFKNAHLQTDPNKASKMNTPRTTQEIRTETANFVEHLSKFYEFHMHILNNLASAQKNVLIAQDSQLETYEQDLLKYKMKVSDLERREKGNIFFCGFFKSVNSVSRATYDTQSWAFKSSKEI